jgi:hypothetical protein
MSNIDNSRRHFFVNVGTAIAGGVLLNLVSGGTTEAQAKPEMIDLTEKVRKDATNKTCVAASKSINYRDSAVELAKEIKSGKVKATPPEIKGKDGKNVPLEARKCSNCALFAMQNPAVHTCILINGCLVQAAGSCTSWSPKPGTI